MESVHNSWVAATRRRLIEQRTPLLLGASSLPLLICLAVSRPTNGDTYVYARSISTFQGPVIHYGYFILGHLLHGVLSLFGSTSLTTLAYMSCLFGSLSALCMYLFTLRLTGDRLRSLLAAGLLLFSGDFWLYSEHGEVYIPEFFFVILSALLILHRKPLLAAVTFAIAISITPTSLLALPALLYLLHMQTYNRREASWFVIPIALGLLALALWRPSDIGEILRTSMYPPAHLAQQMNLGRLARDVIVPLIQVYGKAFSIFSFLSLYGFVLLLRRERKNWLLMVVFTAPFLLYILNVDLFSGDHLIISFLAISFLASAGVVHLTEAARLRSAGRISVIVFLVCLHGWVSYELFIGPERRDASELARVSRELASVFEPNAVLLSQYNAGMSFWYVTQDEPDFSLLTGRPHLFRQKALAKDAADRQLQKRFWVNWDNAQGIGLMGKDCSILQQRPVYLLDTVNWPSWLGRLVLPAGTLEKRASRTSHTFEAVRRFFMIRHHREMRAKKIIDSPLYPVYEVRLE